MALKKIATSAYSKSVVVVVGVSPSGTVAEVGVPSSKVKAVGNGVLKDGYQITVTAITDSGAGATIPDPGPYTVAFSATATKDKADGSLVLREDDVTAVISATPQIPGSPPVTFPVQFKYKISAAGQSKVTGQ